MELGVSDRLSAGLQAAQRRLQAFGASLRSIGTRMTAVAAAAMAPMAASVKMFASTGHELEIAAAKTGISVETLSELSLALEAAGIEMADFEVGIKKMSGKIIDAARGTESAELIFKQLGLSFRDLADLSPEQQFKLIADRISQIQNPTLRAATAVDLFGKSGTRLLPLMQDGARGIEEFQRRARALGLTISTQTAKDATHLAHALGALWNVVKHTGFVIGAALGPTITRCADAVTQAIVATNRWIERNRAIVVTALKVTAAVAAAGASFIAAGMIISGFGTALGGIATIGKLITGIVGGIVGVLGTLLSPVGLAVAAIVSLGSVIVIASGAGGEAIRWLGEQFKGLTGFVSESLGAIANALVVGDIGLAAKVLWASLKLAWVEGSEELKKIWTQMKFYAWTAISDLKNGALATWSDMNASLKTMSSDVVSWLMKKWNWLGTSIKELWVIVSADAKKAMAEATPDWSPEQIKSYQGKVEAQKQAKLAALEKGSAAWDEAVTQANAANKSKITAEHKTELEQIGKQSLAEEAANTKTRDEEMAKAQAGLAKAKADWQAAVAQANAKSPDKGEAAGELLADRIKKAISDVPDTLVGVRQKMDTVGTFNAAAAYGLGAGTVHERTAKATEQTARHTGQIARTIHRSMTFQ